MEVLCALYSFCLAFGRRQGRQQQGRKNGNDGNHDQQLNQRKPLPPVIIWTLCHFVRLFSHVFPLSLPGRCFNIGPACVNFNFFQCSRPDLRINQAEEHRIIGLVHRHDLFVGSLRSYPLNPIGAEAFGQSVGLHHQTVGGVGHRPRQGQVGAIIRVGEYRPGAQACQPRHSHNVGLYSHTVLRCHLNCNHVGNGRARIERQSRAGDAGSDDVGRAVINHLIGGRCVQISGRHGDGTIGISERRRVAQRV